jgi:pSer/pThr/pTyr-binding forkhead associated (FHA) protein
MTLQLVVYEESRPVRKVPVVDQLLIGRGAECSLQLGDGSVSTRHARIVRDGAAFLIEDLGSHNKTVIEGGQSLGRGQRAALRSGMRLLLGRVRLGVEGSPAAKTPAAAAEDLEATLQDPPELELTLQQGAEDDASEDVGEDTVVPSVPEQVREPARVPASEKPAGAPARIPAVKAAPENVGVDSGTLVPSVPDPAIAAHGFLKGLKPRLVVDNDVFRKLVELESGELTVGRKQGGLVINHPLISSPHARIFLDGRHGRLFVEDLKSKNQTFLNGEALVPGVPREIPLQAHLRFGTVDALFLMDKNYDGESLEAQCAKAVALLARSGKLDPARRKQAEQEAAMQEIPLEAALILAGAVTVPQWVKALADARIALVTEGSGSRALRLWLAAAVAALLVLLVLYVLQLT